jgi:hypothetical protein
MFHMIKHRGLRGFKVLSIKNWDKERHLINDGWLIVAERLIDGWLMVDYMRIQAPTMGGFWPFLTSWNGGFDRLNGGF